MSTSQRIGISPEGQSRQPASLYGPTAATPANLTFDVSNNRILASIDPHGVVRRAAIVTGLVREQLGGFNLRGVTGSKCLVLCGPWDIRVQAAHAGQGEPVATTAVDYEDALLPIFIQRKGDLEVHRHLFAPLDGDLRNAPRAILCQLELINSGTSELICTASAGTGTPAAARPFESLIRLDAEAEDGTTGTCRLPAGGRAVLSFAFLIGETAEALRQTEVLLRSRPAAAWHQQTLAWHRVRVGQLSIPENPFWPEFLVRMSELCRQPIMYQTDGSSGGMFIGSNLQDSEMWNRNLWMKDCFYEVLPMALLAPGLCADAIPFFVDRGMPTAPYGRGLERFPDAAPETHSLSLSLAPFVLAGKYNEATGDTAWFKAYPALLETARERFKSILDSRKDKDIFLFPSMYISDGDARGDWHTGSNLLAWYAFHAMARIAAEAYGDTGLASDWAGIANRIAQDLRTRCTGDSPQGRRYFEGAKRDGSFIREKDGEESDMALMPFYGFTSADDPALILHHRIGMSTANPLYSEALDAIWWHDNSWHGTTFPAWITALAGVTGENELNQRLERIAALSDLDGSVWWWPYRYGETDRQAVSRGPVKCAWAAGVFICKVIHDIMGLRVDVPARQVTFRPFHPWSGFSWKTCHMGTALFDFDDHSETAKRTITIRNLNPEPYKATAELVLPENTRLTACLINGTRSDACAITTRYGRKAVRVETELAASQAISVGIHLQTDVSE